MSQYSIQDTTITGIADAVRSQTGGTGALTPSEMTTNINNMYVLRGPDVSLNMTEDFAMQPYATASVSVNAYRNNVQAASYIDTEANVTLYHKSSSEENYSTEPMYLDESGYQYVSSTLLYPYPNTINYYVVVEPSLEALGTYTSQVNYYEVLEPPEE